MLISYNWLKSYVPELPESEKISDIINNHLCEIEGIEKKENDTVFDLNILPDRAHDLLSHQGVARELASLLELDFKLPEYKIPTDNKSNFKIEIETDKCRRYMGRIVRNVKIGPSPKWMADYLTAIGQRSINNIVDATNIVMFDCGQPIHAFDLKELSSEKIVVKNAVMDEELQLVGSEEAIVKLTDSNMMITDGKKNLAIAGVKGGKNSGVSENTKDLLIEVANFEPVSVRRTSRVLGIQTDATKRYENDLSANLCDFAMKEISSLFLDMFPDAKFEEIIDEYPIKKEKKVISFSTEYVSKMLGVEISDKEIEKILKNYNFDYSGNWNVEVPDMRIDLSGPQDMVEEIGRVYGYDKIPSRLPEVDFPGENNPIWDKIQKAKVQLINDGYKEIMTYTFTNRGKVEVLASASDKNFLRDNLSDGLRESLRLNKINAPLLDFDEIKIFEIGTVFFEDREEIHVCFNEKKNIIEMTLKEFSGKKISSEVYGYFSAEKFLVLGPSPSQGTSDETSFPSTFKPWSSYPFISRDISVWVPENTKPEELSKIYEELGTDLLINKPKLFDQFTKDGRTSYAFRLVFQSQERTLTDEEINKVMVKIEEKIASSGWEVR